MISRKHRRENLIQPVLAITFSLIGAGVLSADPNEVLTKQLTEIRADSRSGSADPNELEARCLRLIQGRNSPSEKGMIYAMATFVHCERGFGRPEEQKVRLAKTIEYANKALEYPLDVHTSCRLYGYFGDALMVTTEGGSKDKWSQAREQAATAWLKGLKVALDNEAPREMPTPPLVKVSNVLSPNGRIHEGASRKYEDQKAARKKYDRLRALYLQRRALTNRCVTLYCEDPYNVGQFQDIARKILGEHKDVANELTQRVEARITAGKKSSQLPPPTP